VQTAVAVTPKIGPLNLTSDSVVDVNAYIANLIKIEGGYVNDPTDKGGATKYGVTQTTFDAWRKSIGQASADVSTLTTQEATQIYLQKYWLGPKFDQVNTIYPALAGKLLDIGVNMGQSTGVGYVQRALNVLNMRGASWPDMVVDGGIGTVTLSAIRTFLNARGSDGKKVLLGMVASQQSVGYIQIAEKTPSQEKYEYGWQLNRAFGQLGQ
jgi:lysozyme family protein